MPPTDRNRDHILFSAPDRDPGVDRACHGIWDLFSELPAHE